MAAADDDFDVLNESVDVVEGTWRRMFEVDMREDEADLSSKALEAEIKELEEEIGELNGLDEELIDAVGFGQSFQPTKIGSFVSMSAIPADWKEEMDFFKELEVTNTNKLSGLRAGKASEQAEFESLLKEVRGQPHFDCPYSTATHDLCVSPVTITLPLVRCCAVWICRLSWSWSRRRPAAPGARRSPSRSPRPRT